MATPPTQQSPGANQAKPRQPAAPDIVVARRRVGALTLALALGAACQRPRPTAPPTPESVPAPSVGKVDVEALSARVGVKPGPLAYPGVGPGASLATARGTVTVRRVGEERFTEILADAPLFAGDQVWTTAHASAMVAMADNTLIQLADETLVAIGNRAVSADPASSAAVLYGVARFSISPRARGEGAFLTTAGSVVIGAKGTSFAVAVAAGGQVRVGVEHGEAEVAGPSALNAPVVLQTAEASVVDAAGVAGPVVPFKEDDWGAWRYQIEGQQRPEDAAHLHANRLVGEESRLDGQYMALQTLCTTASTLTWQAEATSKPKAAVEYKANATDRTAAIEGTFRLAAEVARLSYAALSDAFILGELYARHPREVAPEFNEFSQEIAGAILYDKKLQVVSEVYLAPLRPAFYAHTARGRARAAGLGLPAPTVFAAIKLPEVSAAELGRRLPAKLYAPPLLDSVSHGHPVWQRGPDIGWNDRLTLQPVPSRQGAWYVAPPLVTPRLLAGVAPQVALPIAFPTLPPTEPAQTELLHFVVPPLPPLQATAPASKPQVAAP